MSPFRIPVKVGAVTASLSLAVVSGYSYHRYNKSSRLVNEPATTRCMFAPRDRRCLNKLQQQFPSEITKRNELIQDPAGAMAGESSFQTRFAVPLSCEGCVESVATSLYKIKGVNKVDGYVKDQIIAVDGTAPPSSLIEAIQATGRDAILRGSGASDSAAVSILESFSSQVNNADISSDRQVRGLARLVQVGSGRTLVDLTIQGVSPGTYYATIREYGNLADGARSTGPVWSSGDDASSKRKGALGTIQVGNDGKGAAFVDHPFEIWETIGHAMVLTKQDEDQAALQNDESTVVGVIARSAGMWDNDKTVCSCSGKTLWEERTVELKRGIV